MKTCEKLLFMVTWVTHMRYKIDPSPISMTPLASSRQVCVSIVMSPYICHELHAGPSRRRNVTAMESAMVLACLSLSSSNREKECTNQQKPRSTFFVAFYIFHPYDLARLMQGSMMVLISSIYISWYYRILISWFKLSEENETLFTLCRPRCQKSMFFKSQQGSLTIHLHPIRSLTRTENTKRQSLSLPSLSEPLRPISFRATHNAADHRSCPSPAAPTLAACRRSTASSSSAHFLAAATSQGYQTRIFA
jgi:hypothetical protein